MASGPAYIAKGTTLGYSTTIGGTYTPINSKYLMTISPPPYSVGSAETTVLNSTAKTYLPTIFDNGELSFTVQHVTDDPSIAYLVGQASAATAVLFWKITYADASTDVFAGFVTSYHPQEAGVEEVQTAEVTVKVSGALTFTANPV